MSYFHFSKGLVDEKFGVQAFHQGPFRELGFSCGEGAHHGSVQNLLEKSDAPDAVFHEDCQKWRQGILFFCKREERLEGAENSEKVLLVVRIRRVVAVEVDDFAPAAELGGLPDEGIDVEGAAQNDFRLAPVGDGLQEVRLVAQHLP